LTIILLINIYLETNLREYIRSILVLEALMILKTFTQNLKGLPTQYGKNQWV